MTPKEFRDQFAKNKGCSSWEMWAGDAQWASILDEMMEEYRTGKWNCQ